MNRILIIAAGVLLHINIAQAQRALDILGISISPPYPVLFQTYIDEADKMKIMVQNRTFEEQQFYLEFVLERNGSNYARSRIAELLPNENLNPFTLEPIEMRDFDGLDISMSYGQLSNWITFSDPGNNIEALQLAGALPEGNYRLILTAFDLDTRLPLSEPEISNEFTVQLSPPPVIIQPSPILPTPIDPDALTFLFQWDHDIIEPMFSEIEYDLQIIELASDLEANPEFATELFEGGNYFFQSDMIMMRQFDYDMLFDEPFVEGRFYAARVTANDLTNNMAFRNEGRSEPVIFFYGSQEQLDEYGSASISTIYPFVAKMDTLPFAAAGLVLQMEEGLTDFSTFTCNFSINGQSTPIAYSEGIPIDEANPTLSGDILRNVYISGQAEAEVVGGYKRGTQYELKAEDIEVGFAAEDFQLGTQSSSFVYGMPRPAPALPANGATLPSDTVSFVFSTGQMPNRLYPEDGININDVSSLNEGVTLVYSADERWLLQVSENKDFTADSIVYTRNQRIRFETHEGLEPLDLMDSLYKEVRFSLDGEPLEKGKTYHWRVVWLNDPATSLPPVVLDREDYYLASPTYSFSIENSVDAEDPVVATPDSSCNAVCFLAESAYPLDMTAVTARSAMTNQNVIQAGRFNVAIDNISFSGENASGSGTVDVSFYGLDAKIKVEWSNVKINAQSQLIDGMVKASKDDLELPEVLSTLGIDQELADLFITDEEAEMINNVLETYRQISALATGESIGMPIGINYEYDDVELLFALTNMSFEPRQASVQILMNIPIMIFDEIRYLSLGVSRLCFTPAGFGPEAVLHMVKPLTYDVGDFEQPFTTTPEDLERFSISLLGPEDLDEQENIQATKLEFDCNGIKSFGIRGNIAFPNDILLRENENGIVNTSERVNASFYFALGRDRQYPDGGSADSDSDEETSESEGSAKTDDGVRAIHIVAELERMDQFQFPDLPDWSFGVQRAYFDFSQIENAIGFDAAVPDDYSHTAFGQGENDKQWQGFWLRDAKMRLPNFIDDDGQRIEVNVHNMIIDEQYFTANINIQPDIDGAIEDWSISLDSIWLQITENRFEDGGFAGEIGMPLIEQDMAYTSRLIYEGAEEDGPGLAPPPAEPTNPSIQYAFDVRPAANVDIPFMMAQAKLTSETYIRLGYKHNMNDGEEDGGEIVFEAALAGGLSLSSDFVQDQAILSALPFDLSLMELPFMVKYSTVDGLDGYFGFNQESQQALMAGINEIQQEFSDAGADLETLTSYLDGSSEEGGGQGKMAGFSFGIREFSMDAQSLDYVELTIHPFINIVGSEDTGFGGESLFSIVGGYDASTKKMKLVSPYITAASVEIDATFSGIGVKGGVCFYNQPGDGSGLKGYIDVALPILRAEAKFQAGVKYDEEGPYEHFFFQFLVRLATGIDLGNYTYGGTVGVAFYGAGAGFYWNMGYESPALAAVQQAVNDAPSSSQSVGPVADPAKQDGGDGCSFDFPGVFIQRGNFRLEGILVLGTTTNSMPVNLDAKFGLNVTLNSSAFGASIDLEVKGFVCADILSDRELMAPAYFIGAMQLGIEMAMPQPGEDYPIPDVWLQAGLNIYVQVPPPGLGIPPIVKGALVDADGTQNLAAQMSLMFSNSQGNYFNMGSPSNPARVTMGIGDLANIEGKMYLMIGDNVPVGLPPLPDPIPDLLQRINEGPEASLVEGFVSGGIGEERSGPAVNYELGSQGMGFAYGEQYSLGLGIESSILTARLDAVVGFDANVSYYDESCGDEQLGFNGWYAAGQGYAGIQGELAVKDVLFGSNQVIPVLDLGAVLAVQAGSPNPTYIDGVAGVYLDVLGGLISGTAYFKVSAGEVCLPAGVNDPMRNAQVIAFIEPGDNVQNHDPTVAPEAGFHMVIDRSFDFQKTNDDGSPGQVIQVTPRLDKFELKRGNQTISCDLRWNYNKTKCSCKTNAILDPNTQYSIRVRVTAEGTNYSEEETIYFRTGDLPDQIPDNLVAFTNPMNRKRYWLQDELAGRIAFTQDLRPYFPTGWQFEQRRYFLKIRETSTNDWVFEQDITDYVAQLSTVQRLSFQTTSWDLNDGQVYALELTTRRTSAMMATAQYDYISSLVQQISTAQYGDQSDDVSVVSQLDQENKVEFDQGETSLLTIYFKPSAYKTLNEKLSDGSLSLDDDGYFYLTLDEPFDTQDLNGKPGVYNGLINLSQVQRGSTYQGLRNRYLSAGEDLRDLYHSTAFDSHSDKAYRRSGSGYEWYTLYTQPGLVHASGLYFTKYLGESSANLIHNGYLDKFSSNSPDVSLDFDPGGTHVPSNLSNQECGIAGSNQYQMMQQQYSQSSNITTSIVLNGVSQGPRYRVALSPSSSLRYGLKSALDEINYMLYASPYHSNYSFGYVFKKQLQDEAKSLLTQFEAQSSLFDNEVNYAYPNDVQKIKDLHQGAQYHFKLKYRLELAGSSFSRNQSNRLIGSSSYTASPYYGSPLIFQIMTSPSTPPNVPVNRKSNK